jgi:ribosome-binding protein aMBF1 (putative translation factor)
MNAPEPQGIALILKVAIEEARKSGMTHEQLMEMIRGQVEAIRVIEPQQATKEAISHEPR